MEQLINFIIRPPRAEYNPNNDLLDQEFLLKGKWYQRKDVEVKNSRGDILQCSHYVPIGTPDEKPLPCVIYCHGNSGCRADASEAAIMLLPSNITVFTLDFSGSGLSGGEHVTLGWNEKDDLKAVVEYLRQDGNVSLIGLWGRSMGAVTSLMYGAEDPSIAGMVLDSPFSDLVDLMMELVDIYKIRLPKFTVKFAIQYMKKAIQKKAKFDITELNTIKVAKCCFVPALFGHAIEDDFIQPHHSDRIYEAYLGDKNIIKFEGDHNSPRPQFYFDSINIFFHNVLHPPEDDLGGTYFDTMHGYFGKESWTSVPGPAYNFETLGTSKVVEPSSSQVDPIRRVRPKLPMSRMEVPSDISTEDKGPDAEGKEIDHDQLWSSSSNMISFELSDGHPYGPQVPTIMDDDQYVEYQLDDLTGFPGSAEEEEQMLMEAVIASIRDLEMQQPPKEDQATGVSPISIESADPSVGTRHSDSLEQSYNSTTQQQEPSNGEVAPPATNCQTSAAEQPLSALRPLSSAPASDNHSSTIDSASTTTTASTGSESSGTIRSSIDTDLLGNTKATVSVERNPASPIMDGLIRRWDFNFFRSNR